jgi:hypothetical protein
MILEIIAVVRGIVPYGNERILEIEKGSTRSHCLGELAFEEGMDLWQDRLRDGGGGMNKR